MKRLVLAGLGALAVVTVIGSANAADLPRRQAMPAKAPIYMPPVWSWTGFYVGINGGGAFGHSDFSAPFPTGSFNMSGGLVGGTLGYNYQMDNVVLGVEGDIDWSNIRGSAPCAATNCETRNNWLGTTRGRLGYAFGNFMPYVTGGLAVGDIKSSIAGVGNADQTKAGWTAGVGVEARINGPWSLKAEYLYVDLGRGGSVLGSDSKFQTHLVRGGVNYKF